MKIEICPTGAPDCPGDDECLGMMPMMFMPSPEEIEEGWDDPSDSIAIDQLPEALARLVEPDRIAAEADGASIVLDYPLDKPVIRSVPVEGGSLTVRDVVDLIGQTYREVYAREDASAPASGDGPGIYGIWGHHIHDLFIEGVHLYHVDGHLWIEPIMGS